MHSIPPIHNIHEKVYPPAMFNRAKFTATLRSAFTFKHITPDTMKKVTVTRQLNTTSSTCDPFDFSA